MVNKDMPSQCGEMHSLLNGCRTTILLGQSQGVQQNASSEASALFKWMIGATNLLTATIKHFAS